MLMFVWFPFRISCEPGRLPGPVRCGAAFYANPHDDYQLAARKAPGTGAPLAYCM